MTFEWPQIVYACMTIIYLSIAAVMDGEPRKGNHKFGIALISCVFSWWLLWEGGFFGA